MHFNIIAQYFSLSIVFLKKIVKNGNFFCVFFVLFKQAAAKAPNEEVKKAENKAAEG